MKSTAFSLAVLLGLALPKVAPANDCPQPQQLVGLPFEAFESLSLQSCGTPDLLLIMGAGQLLLADTALDAQLRGDMCLALIADEVQRRSETPDFDPEEAVMQALLAALAEQQYHLALQPPSDWEKLWHYAEVGEWAYITQRFFDRGLHYYLLFSLVGGVFAFSGLRRWRRRREKLLP